MTILDTLSHQLQSPVSTQTADATSLATNIDLEPINEAWEHAIDKCIAWGETPGVVDEDDLESPSVEAASRAGIILTRLRQCKVAPPTWVVSSGEGGIVLELIRGSRSAVFEIESDGEIEFRAFENSKLIIRDTVLL